MKLSLTSDGKETREALALVFAWQSKHELTEAEVRNGRVWSSCLFILQEHPATEGRYISTLPFSAGTPGNRGTQQPRPPNWTIMIFSAWTIRCRRSGSPLCIHFSSGSRLSHRARTSGVIWSSLSEYRMIARLMVYTPRFTG